MASDRTAAPTDERRAGRADGARPRRPRELQDRLNLYLYHPLAWTLARWLAPTRVTPDMVSIAGALTVAAAAIAYAGLAWPGGALLGLALHMAWHVIDGADGDLARITGRSGPHGELIDGVCDYAGHIVLYLVLAHGLEPRVGWIAWPLAVAAGLSRIVQANHYESERRQYQWRVYGTPWLGTTRDGRSAARRRVPGFAALGVAYLALASRLSPRAPAIDAALTSAAHEPARLERARAIVRRTWLALPAYLDLLRSNDRTVALGVSMLAGSPLYYFVYEVVVLNAVLVGSIAAHRAGERAISAALGAAEEAAWTR